MRTTGTSLVALLFLSRRLVTAQLPLPACGDGAAAQAASVAIADAAAAELVASGAFARVVEGVATVSYTHLRAHETLR